MGRGLTLCPSRSPPRDRLSRKEMSLKRFLGSHKALTLAVVVAVAVSLALCSANACLPLYSALQLQFGCTGPPDPPRAPPIEGLLIDESLFPNGWHAYDNTFNPRKRLPAEQVGLNLYCAGSGGAGQEVYRFSGGSRCAAMGYREETPVWFARSGASSPWSVPGELPYQSTVADQFRFSCQAQATSTLRQCQGVGQYQQYIVVFRTYMSPECMTFAQLERILLAIDQRMALYLEKETE